VTLLGQGGWTRWPTEVPSNPYYSVILWFCDSSALADHSRARAKRGWGRPGAAAPMQPRIKQTHQDHFLLKSFPLYSEEGKKPVWTLPLRGKTPLPSPMNPSGLPGLLGASPGTPARLRSLHPPQEGALGSCWQGWGSRLCPVVADARLPQRTERARLDASKASGRRACSGDRQQRQASGQSTCSEGWRLPGDAYFNRPESRASFCWVSPSAPALTARPARSAAGLPPFPQLRRCPHSWTARIAQQDGDTGVSSSRQPRWTARSWGGFSSTKEGAGGCGKGRGPACPPGTNSLAAETGWEELRSLWLQGHHRMGRAQVPVTPRPPQNGKSSGPCDSKATTRWEELRSLWLQGHHRWEELRSLWLQGHHNCPALQHMALSFYVKTCPHYSPHKALPLLIPVAIPNRPRALHHCQLAVPSLPSC